MHYGFLKVCMSITLKKWRCYIACSIRIFTYNWNYRHKIHGQLQWRPLLCKPDWPLANFDPHRWWHWFSQAPLQCIQISPIINCLINKLENVERTTVECRRLEKKKRYFKHMDQVQKKSASFRCFHDHDIHAEERNQYILVCIPHSFVTIHCYGTFFKGWLVNGN